MMIRYKICSKCEFIECVCDIIETHLESYKFRKAATFKVAIECDHGYDVCPECDSCTCKELNAKKNKSVS